jgi:hypothetical protein
MAGVDIIARIEGSVEDGGWRTSGSVIGEAERLEFYQQLESWFDLYAGGWEALPRPGFAGHLLPEPWEKTFQTSVAPWNGYTAQEFMKKGRVQGIFFRDEASPANRHQIIDMTYAKIVYEIFGGHCNLMRADQAALYDNSLWGGAFSTVTSPEGFVSLDFDFSSSSAVDEYEVKEGNFWERLREIAEIDRYLLYVSKNGVLHFGPHPMFGGALPTPVFTLGNDWLAEPLRFERRNGEEIGQVILHGVTPRGLQLRGRYPTDANPGPIVERSGYVATTNALMNTISERIFKFENRDYTVEVRIGSGVGLLVELLDRVQITYMSLADGINWNSKKFWIHKVVVELLSNFTARTMLRLEAENG